ncbi:MAG: alpha/beta fold hydrolase [Alphaproteobacteria bacterium]
MKLQGQEIDVVRKGSGQPLLLLHGGGGPIAAMPFADKLAEKFEIIAPTHPGFGGSKIPDHFNRVDDLVFLYLDLLDELDLNDVILMGFSMGGWTAVELATMNSTRLSKMPTHFIWGESDGIVTVDYGQKYCKLIDGATMTVIENAGHSPQVEQPEAFVDAVFKCAG